MSDGPTTTPDSSAAERELKRLFDASRGEVPDVVLARLARVAGETPERARRTRRHGFSVLLRRLVPAAGAAAILLAGFFIWLNQGPTDRGGPEQSTSLARVFDAASPVMAANDVAYAPDMTGVEEALWAALAEEDADPFWTGEEEGRFGLDLLHAPATRKEQARWLEAYELLLADAD